MLTAVIRRIAKMRIGVKLLLAPGLCTLVLSSLVPMSLYAIGTQSALLTRLTTSEASKEATITALVRTIPEASNRINRLIALISNSDDTKAAKRLADALDQDLTRAASLLERLSRFELQPEESRIVYTLNEPMRQFARSARDAAEMAAAGDSANAFITGNQSSNQYATLVDGLTALQKLEEERAAAEKQSSDTLARTVSTALIVVFGLALAASIGVSVFLARVLGSMITGLAQSMLVLATGNTEVEIPGTDQGDEVGEMARAAESFRRAAIDSRAAMERAAEERKAVVHRLAHQFEDAVAHSIEAVSSASVELEAVAGTLTNTAAATQQLSGSVAAASQQASANVRSVASAIEEMTSSAHEISHRVQKANEIAASAVTQAKRTDGRVAELSHAASRIGEVIKLINTVAEQTNLLALNATIEAARAGEAGRGFAVVAQEVKALAAQTAKATDEIGLHIAGIQAATQDAVATIKEIGITIGGISEIASTVAAAVEEQGAVTQEIARSVQDAVRGTTEVAANVTEVNRNAGKATSASSQVLASTQAIAKESTILKDEVQRFLATVRVA
jgi:methyl-accepting chemotaxis protein